MQDRNGETNFSHLLLWQVGRGVTNIKKGTKLFVVGDLEISSFMGVEGEKWMTFRIVADTYRILGSCDFRNIKRPYLGCVVPRRMVEMGGNCPPLSFPTGR